MMRRIAMGLGVFLGACGGKEGAAPAETGGPPAAELLHGDALLRRVSFDLRGIPPTPDELDRAEASGWTVVRDEFLDDPMLEERLVHLFSQTWHTRVDVFDMAVEGVRIALRHMTPVILLVDGYLSNASEPWLIPIVEALAPIERHTPPDVAGGPDAQMLAYQRDPESLGRPWITPGMPGLVHRTLHI